MGRGRGPALDRRSVHRRAQALGPRAGRTSCRWAAGPRLHPARPSRETLYHCFFLIFPRFPRSRPALPATFSACPVSLHAGRRPCARSVRHGWPNPVGPRIDTVSLYFFHSESGVKPAMALTVPRPGHPARARTCTQATFGADRARAALPHGQEPGRITSAETSRARSAPLGRQRLVGALGYPARRTDGWRTERESCLIPSATAASPRRSRRRGGRCGRPRRRRSGTRSPRTRGPRPSAGWRAPSCR